MSHEREIQHTLERLHAGRTIEVRVLGLQHKGRRITASGYFDDFERCSREVVKLDSQGAEGIYVTLNELHRGLLARCPNQMQLSPQRTTSDNDVVAVRWALVDIDPVRPSGISASDREVSAAADVRDSILRFLGSDLPGMISAFSGNGFHLLTPIDDQDDCPAAEGMLAVLHREFSTDVVKVDTSVTKRAQLTKLYGTLARKGYEIGTRRHRRSFLEM